MLSELPFFRDFTLDALSLISAFAMHVRLEGGVEIFREGEPADRFYVIRSGRIAIETHGPDGRRIPLQVLGPGDVVGWSWLLPPHVWHFDARTLEPIDAVCFAGSRLREACESNHGLGYLLVRGMAQALVQRLDAARLRVFELMAPKP